VNKWLQLVPFPSTAFRNTVLVALALDVGLALFWDRFMLAVFAFPVFKASLKGTTMKDVTIMLRGFAVVAAIVYWLATQEYDEEMWAEVWAEAEARAEGSPAPAPQASARSLPAAFTAPGAAGPSTFEDDTMEF